MRLFLFGKDVRSSSLRGYIGWRLISTLRLSEINLASRTVLS